MRENLMEPASAQYDKWVGTAAADDVDMHSLGKLLGLDTEKWDLVVVDLSVNGGYQSITGWATKREDGEYENRKQILAASGGVLEVTKVIDCHEEPHDHADTNPPRPPALPITWASEVVALGFKRLQIRLVDVQTEFRDLVTEIYEVASIVDED